MVVRRVKKDEVEFFFGRVLVGVGFEDGGVFDVLEVLFEGLEGFGVVFDKSATFGAAREGFEAEGAGASEEVEDGFIFYWD